MKRATLWLVLHQVPVCSHTRAYLLAKGIVNAAPPVGALWLDRSLLKPLQPQQTFFGYSKFSSFGGNSPSDLFLAFWPGADTAAPRLMLLHGFDSSMLLIFGVWSPNNSLGDSDSCTFAVHFLEVTLFCACQVQTRHFRSRCCTALTAAS